MTNLKERLVAIVGAPNVCDEEKVLENFAGDKSFVKPIIPRFSVKIHSGAEAEELVKLANETKTPLVPVSSKGPHYNGDTVPGEPGAVIVDFSEMKKIVSVNRTHRIGIVEPGVTYAELLEELKKHNLTISMPLAPRAGKTVVGSVLETEPRLNSLHQWCFLDPLRCVEVTWGDGRRMYTGEAAGSVMDLEQQWKADKWQWEPVGPFMLDFFRMLTGAQGSMGLVSWASVRLEQAPRAHELYFVPANKLEDISDFFYRIIKMRFSDEFFILSGTELAYLMAKDAEEAVRLRADLPNWVAIIGFIGRDFLPEQRVAAQREDTREIAQTFGLKLVSALPGLRAAAVMEKISSPCPEGAYWKDVYKGAFQEIFFATTLDRTPEFVSAMYAEAELVGYPTEDVGVYIQPENMGTSYRCCFTLPYDAGNAKETARMKTLFKNASEKFSFMNAYYLRPYGIWAGLQLNKDAQSYKTITELKGIFDPNGVMNPGKLRIN